MKQMQRSLSSGKIQTVKCDGGEAASVSKTSHMLPLDTDSDTDAEQDQVTQFDKIGMLVAVVDDAANDYVFGPCGSPGRPDGVLDIDLLASFDRSGTLGDEGHAKWMQFVRLWELAGWSLDTLLQVTEELRPLQYGSNLEEEDLVGVSSEQLDACIRAYCNFREVPADQLQYFLQIVQQNFVQSNSVLVLARDALQS